MMKESWDAISAELEEECTTAAVELEILRAQAAVAAAVELEILRAQAAVAQPKTPVEILRPQAAVANVVQPQGKRTRRNTKTPDLSLQLQDKGAGVEGTGASGVEGTGPAGVEGASDARPTCPQPGQPVEAAAGAEEAGTSDAAAGAGEAGGAGASPFLNTPEKDADGDGKDKMQEDI